MSKVYKMVELVGTSTKSMEDATKNALEKASKTIRNMSWFEVLEIRGGISKELEVEWQVSLKVGFTVED